MSTAAKSQRARAIARWVFGLGMAGAGANHFINPDFYVQIMPPQLPWHAELVRVSGACEAALGAALLIPQWQRMAAWGLVALLVAVFPANIHMAVHDVAIDGAPAGPAWALWLRLPLQGVLIGWVYWAAIQRPGSVANIGGPEADRTD